MLKSKIFMTYLSPAWEVKILKWHGAGSILAEILLILCFFFLTILYFKLLNLFLDQHVNAHQFFVNLKDIYDKYI